MKTLCRSLSLIFAAGCFGALISDLAIWGAVTTELTKHFNVNIKPNFHSAWIYSTTIWGGLYGLLFLLPYLTRSYFFRGLIYSLVPSFIQLFIIYPFVDGQGLLGMDLGDLAPVFVVIFNAIWGISAGLWLQFTEK